MTFLAVLSSNKNGKPVKNFKGIIEAVLTFTLGEKIDTPTDQKKDKNKP